MSSRIVFGKPGGGKGYVTVEKYLIPELLHGERSVISSLAVRVEPWVRKTRSWGITRYKPEIGLRNYLLQKYGKDFNVSKRVHLIDEEQVREFFKYRVKDGKVIELPVNRDPKGNAESFDTSQTEDTGPVLYLIDEAPLVFGSRDWATTPKGVLFYNRQHRKFDDDVIYNAQHSKDMDSALQRVAQEFVMCTNRAKMKFKWFTQPSVIQIDVFDKPPIGPSVSPMVTTYTKIDKNGIGACFDTSKGVGISSSGGADMNEKKKGLPWWLIPIALVLIGLALAKGSDYLGNAMTHAFGFGGKKAPTKAATTTPAVGHQSQFNDTNSVSTVPLPQASQGTNELKCLGIFRWSYKRTDAFLSDGRTVTQPELEEVTKTHVRVDGADLRYGSMPSGDALPSTILKPIGNESVSTFPEHRQTLIVPPTFDR